MAESEFPAFWDAVAESLGTPPPPGEREAVRPLVEPGRTLAAFDGRRIIGTALAHGLEMSVPGGMLPVAGVGRVGVLPSHRRRGVLRSLMRRQLADLRERGESLAALFASEAGIYGRYGYGCAGYDQAFEIHRGESAFVRGAPTDGRLRLTLTGPDEVWPRLAQVYDAKIADRPGQFARDGAWWNLRLFHPSQDALRCVIAEDPARARGYALYSVRPGLDRDGIPDNRITLVELTALDPPAHALLWRHLLDLDLVASLVAPRRPSDDPLRHLLQDPRRLRARFADGLWVRPVDLGRALSARAYAADVDLVMEVHDPMCAWNSGRWHLAASAGRGRCERTLRPADVALPVQVIGAAYLGGVSVTAQARAGLVRELTPGSVTALSRALAWDPAPWCPMAF
ncbi:GNAT family N-acetyltransferase [Spirillospora sp. CA-294931]|uniref:GNAT family N-acetyltransferase n=1 Tax=Spirillospora sp. CA-294931 TaxID=3240042 RepID=UPI003D8FAE1C